ncbi:MAG: hypothetical protein OXC42_07755 [Gammaproteobacteria bacterium]|nr:hypothetical protein [Gammaproteobacteria bacterium]
MPGPDHKDSKKGIFTKKLKESERGEIENLTFDELTQPRPGEEPFDPYSTEQESHKKTRPDKASKPYKKSASQNKKSQPSSGDKHHASASEVKEITPDSRKDSCILAHIRVTEHSEREAGQLFGGLCNKNISPQPDLPLFPDTPLAKQVPLLDIVDLAGVPIRASNGAVPIEMRLFIRTLSAVPQQDRAHPVVRMALTLRELRDGLFPNGWHRANQWPKLRNALVTANDHAFHYQGQLWLPLSLRSLPDNPQLNDKIVIDIAFPKGATTGPIINLQELDKLSVVSSPHYRAMIGVYSLTWVPGKTRKPVPRTKSRYGWAQDQEAYPVLTQKDRRRIAFGPHDKKHRTQSEIDKPFADIPGFKVINKSATDVKTGEVGWRMVPAELTELHQSE